MEQGGNNSQLLFHAVGIGADGLAQVGGQFKHLPVAPDPLLPLRLAHAKDITDKIQKLYPCHKIMQIRVVRQISDLPLAGNRFRPDRFAPHQDLAAVKR